MVHCRSAAAAAELCRSDPEPAERRVPSHKETDVSAAAPAGPSKGVAVTIIGWITILWGGAHAVLGGCLIVGGDAIDKNLR